jgi:flagellin-like protein
MKLGWKEEAVSPVIATILMVAITVVLAAVLYVMVIGMGGTAVVQTPVGNWQDMSPLSNSSAKMIFGNFEPQPQFMDLKIIVEVEGGGMFNLSWSGSTLTSADTNMTCDGAGITAVYHDQSFGNSQIGGGDYIEIHGLKPFTFYYVKVFHYPSDSICQMAGDTNFQTLP